MAAYLSLLLSLADLMVATTFPPGHLLDIFRRRYLHIKRNPEDIEDPRAEMVAHLRQFCRD